MGTCFGLPATGLASGFVSSTATIGAMAALAKKAPVSMNAAVAGAVFSAVATFVQLSSLLAALSRATLLLLAPALAAGALVAGFADAHSPAISVASLVAGAKMAPREAMLPILAAVTSNTVSKLVVARGMGSQAFLLRIAPGGVAPVAAAWAAALVLG